MVNLIAQNCFLTLPLEQVPKLFLMLYIYLAKTVLLAQVSMNGYELV